MARRQDTQGINEARMAALEAEAANRAKKPKINFGQALKKFARGAGSVTGKVVKTTASGVYEGGKAFAEGAGIPKPTVTGVAHTVGHITGSAVKGAVKQAARIEVRQDPRYYWGPGGGPVTGFIGGARNRDWTPSTLPTQVQVAIHNYIANLHPEVRETIKEGVPTMPLSEFVGKLRIRYPEIYEQARAWVYDQIGRTQSSYGQTSTTGYYGQRPATSSGGSPVYVIRP